MELEGGGEDVWLWSCLGGFIIISLCSERGELEKAEKEEEKEKKKGGGMYEGQD